mmetsp:Transcript_36394/g.32662  ORF Transcript_36394/g.32662 Transcript_36394/m.32662 type:complete len:101 (-) Transcript_36394:1667-1969(-)
MNILQKVFKPNASFIKAGNRCISVQEATESQISTQLSKYSSQFSINSNSYFQTEFSSNSLGSSFKLANSIAKALTFRSPYNTSSLYTPATKFCFSSSEQA